MREQAGAALKAGALHRSLIQQTQLRERAEREQLQKETAIAQRIQCAILPDGPRVRGLEIAARMIPATTVGGDYYDVIPTADGCWIGFGDVTGHGLLSGLIMLMIQSMVHAVTSATPNAKPSDIVTAVNQSLFENVHNRLTLDDYATFTLIRFTLSGSLAFSGAHEEILVLRNDATHCEGLQSPGIWLGLLPDVRQFATDAHAQLKRGDLVVVYSDGITEAMNPDREQFGVARLTHLVEQHRDLEANAVCDMILNRVQAWAATQMDDMTIVVARYRDDEDAPVVDIDAAPRESRRSA